MEKQKNKGTKGGKRTKRAKRHKETKGHKETKAFKGTRVIQNSFQARVKIFKKRKVTKGS